VQRAGSLLKKEVDGDSLMVLMLKSYLSFICTILNSNITPQEEKHLFSTVPIDYSCKSQLRKIHVIRKKE